MPSPVTLTGKQTRHLRSLAHALKPVIQVGKLGWTEAVRDEADRALESHELIKMKVGSECPEDLGAISKHAEKDLGAAIAQTIGAIVVLYRPHPKDPKIRLPRPGTPS